MRGCLCLLLAAGLAQAGEYAVLSTGFRLHADRHERNGDTITLIDGDGSIELSAADVAGFEAEDPPPAPPPAPTPEPAPAALPADPQSLVAEAARYAELPVALVASVARAESGFQVNAVSPKGALGVMQLMPSTAAGFQADPHDVTQNIYAGALYLRQLLFRNTTAKSPPPWPPTTPAPARWKNTTACPLPRNARLRKPRHPRLRPPLPPVHGEPRGRRRRTPAARPLRPSRPEPPAPRARPKPCPCDLSAAVEPSHREAAAPSVRNLPALCPSACASRTLPLRTGRDVAAAPLTPAPARRKPVVRGGIAPRAGPYRWASTARNRALAASRQSVAAWWDSGARPPRASSISVVRSVAISRGACR